MPAPWSWDDYDRRILPSRVYGSDRDAMALDWLVYISKSCSSLNPFAISRNWLAQRDSLSPARKGFFFQMLKYNIQKKVSPLCVYIVQSVLGCFDIIVRKLWGIDSGEL